MLRRRNPSLHLLPGASAPAKMLGLPEEETSGALSRLCPVGRGQRSKGSERLRPEGRKAIKGREGGLKSR